MWSVSQGREVRIGGGHLSASVNKKVHSYWPTHRCFDTRTIVMSQFWSIAVLKADLTVTWHNIYREMLCLFPSLHFSSDEVEISALMVMKADLLLSWTECFNEQTRPCVVNTDFMSCRWCHTVNTQTWRVTGILPFGAQTETKVMHF